MVNKIPFSTFYLPVCCILDYVKVQYIFNVVSDLEFNVLISDISLAIIIYDISSS